MVTLPKSLEPDRDELIRRARALAPVLRARSVEINRARAIPTDILGMLRDAGLMQLARPTRYGGRDEGMDLIFEITRILAEGDGSTAWVYGITSSHDHLVGLYPKAVQDEYWSSDQALSASSFQPSGKAVRVDGGYQLSGQWSFCSGIDHCGWVVVGVIVGILPGDEPAPDLRLIILRKRDLEVVDDWRVMGLAGTGSKSVVAEDLFVPDRQILSNADVMRGDTPGRALHDNPLYGVSIWFLIGFSIVAAATGIARGAYDSLVDDFRQRAEAHDPMFESRRAAVQMRLADASAYIDAAELLYQRSLRETQDLIMRGTPVSDAIRTRNRRDQAFLARLCRQAMDILMTIAGGRGIRDGGVVQQAMRDIFAISAHPGGNWDSASMSFGSVALGGPPTEMFC